MLCFLIQRISCNIPLVFGYYVLVHDKYTNTFATFVFWHKAVWSILEPRPLPPLVMHYILRCGGSGLGWRLSMEYVGFEYVSRAAIVYQPVPQEKTKDSTT